jgi:hypothetical protein
MQHTDAFGKLDDWVVCAECLFKFVSASFATRSDLFEDTWLLQNLR